MTHDIFGSVTIGAQDSNWNVEIIKSSIKSESSFILLVRKYLFFQFLKLSFLFNVFEYMLIFS